MLPDLRDRAAVLFQHALTAAATQFDNEVRRGTWTLEAPLEADLDDDTAVRATSSAPHPAPLTPPSALMRAMPLAKAVNTFAAAWNELRPASSLVRGEDVARATAAFVEDLRRSLVAAADARAATLAALAEGYAADEAAAAEQRHVAMIEVRSQGVAHRACPNAHARALLMNRRSQRKLWTMWGHEEPVSIDRFASLRSRPPIHRAGSLFGSWMRSNSCAWRCRF